MVKNFLFHRVHPQRDLLWDPMDPVLFDKCIRYIAATHEVVMLEELVSGKIPYDLKKKYATIVFDDGYKDNLEYAVPVLHKYKIRASFYVVTDCIDKNLPTWTHIFDYRFQHTGKSELNLNFDFLAPDLRVTQLDSPEKRINYARKLKPALKKLSHDQRNEVLRLVDDSFNDVTLPQLMMNWNEVRELKNAGHYIGSHTVAHSMLGTMKNEDEIRHELVDSGNRIKQELGYFPATISYPVGSFNKRVMELGKRAGYLIGLAVKQTVYDPQLHHQFEIPRIELYNESWLKTKLRITNIYGKISKLLRR